MGKKFSSDEERREYYRNHYRVGVRRGRAKDQSCACGAPAAEWAHLHDTDGADPANYEAMCRPCHQRYDNRWNPEERAKVAASVKASWDSHHDRDRAFSGGLWTGGKAGRKMSEKAKENMRSAQKARRAREKGEETV